jgi:alanine racemase
MRLRFRSPTERRPEPSADAADAAHVTVKPPTRPPIEARLAASGLPPIPRLAWLELDLDALAANVVTLRSLAGGAPVHPVVKADAYGHGAVPIAQALASEGIDGLCVATMDEAVQLRDAGIAVPIRVLYVIPPGLVDDAVRHDISVAAGDRGSLDELLAAAGARDGAVTDRPLLLEIEVETGLGRGGVASDEVVAMVDAIQRSAVARLVGFWTHLQASDDAPITARQIERFELASAALAGAFSAPRDGPEPSSHVAASGGLLTGVAAFGGVRPGLSAYGIVPDELAGHDLRPPGAGGFRPVMSLHARPIRVVDLPAGYGVSYGPTFTTARPSRIATLPLGYGDGFARAFANRAAALVRGRRVPLVGNITRDAVMADVTDVPGEPVGPADEFVLLGPQGSERITVEELARLRTTNTWEVVTQMSGRLPRVYHAAAEVKGLRTLAGWRG